MKLVFFNRFFHPDTSATSQMLTDLAFHLARRGRDVHVVTSRVPAGLLACETIDGVVVHRVADATGGSRGLLSRARAYFQYYAGARRAARQILAPGDVVIVKTDPPLLLVAIASIARARRARVVCWLQDLFPEVAERYGIPGTGRVGGAWLRHLRNRDLRRADRVVAIGDRMQAQVRGAGAGERLAVIHNWADGTAIVPQPATSALRDAWGLQGKFVVGYSGNFGRVHEFETLLAAAALLKEEPGIAFVLVGGGVRLAEVTARVHALGLGNVVFKPHQPRESLSQSLGVADVHVACLRPEFEGLVHPSKLYGIMAAGRPTVFIGDAKGECGSILARTDAGSCVGVGDAQALARALLALRDDPARRAALGHNARRAFEAEYDMPLALAQWERLLESVAAEGARP